MSQKASQIIDAYKLVLDAQPVLDNPFMPQNSEDMDHWFCKLTNDSVEFDFYISRGGDFNGEAPSAEFALSFVLDDIGAFKSCDGYAGFCKMLSIDTEDERASLAYEELTRLSENLELVLASDVNINITPSI